ncbi:putative inositol phosphosphingolipids phospholipase c protein [Botrytis fragariae]|uniref:Putative inositol phosphosphingolipids phospholipase c protein n=1 Tax=Botrytis fragariae TaxID=1964551 RepID=A0A8H6AYD9_9HELO|nr:putative inositol phosphosphingolipids phospholipase c protein [Botrytis fragariae]KAF5875735.1 putative inositol phosphosphingolipids phospholipase c protein [Botrytis fragariae]
MDSPSLQVNEINVITLNCWGLKFISTLRNERLTEIGQAIGSANPTPHIVGLQECWTQEDYKSIRKETKHILPYGKFYHSGIFGGGLAILSKWPIEESSMFRYPLNGRPTAFFRGDWFVGKGVAGARIRFGQGPKDIVELHAPYETEPNDSYICHRTAQAWEIAKLMRGAAERGHLVLGLGDFNMIPLSLAHRLISTHSPARDVWMVLHPDCSIGAAIDEVEKARRRPIPTAEFNLSENGATCDSVLNTWRWSKGEQKRLGPNRPEIEIAGDTPDPRAKRLDYIFANTCFDENNPSAGGWIVKDARVGMLQRHSKHQCSLSDHFSVEATLVHTKYASPTEQTIQNKSAVSNGVYLQTAPSESHLLSAHTQLKTSSSPPYLPISTYDEIIAMIHTYRLRERRQRRLRLGHFVASVFISIGCFVAVWWSPRNFVAFILMLLSSLGLGAGVIDGLIGGLFVGSEIRALKEFEWEISNARAAANGEPLDLAEEGIQDWLPSPTDAERLVGMEMELELERHAEETREMERREREERRIEVNEMDRARREAESRMMGWNLGVGMAYRHGETIGNNIEPVNIDHLLRERTLQAERGRLGQGERAVWQENGETRYQEMARQQNPLSRRREENRRLGTAGFSSMEIGSQEAEEETRGGGGGKKLLPERQETEEERTERLRLNEKSR